MEDLKNLIPFIIFDRHDTKVLNNYYGQRKDIEGGFKLQIFRKNILLATVVYHKDGPKLDFDFEDTTEKERNIIMSTVRSCLKIT